MESDSADSHGEFGDWVIVKAENDDQVAIFRVRTDEPSDMSVCTENVCISWPYQGDDHGFPSKADGEAMAMFEDAIADLTGTPEFSQLVLVVTGFDVREWHFYVADYSVFMAELNALLQRSPKLPLEIVHTPDPGWSIWRTVRDRAVTQ